MTPDEHPPTPDPLRLPQTNPPPPAFSCHVYLFPQEDGRLRAEVANLAGIAVTADNERSALRQVAAAFKERITAHLSAGDEIPWRDPPACPPDASERFLPMHL